MKNTNIIIETKQNKKSKAHKENSQKRKFKCNKLMKKGSTSLIIKEKQNRVEQEAFGHLRLTV